MSGQKAANGHCTSPSIPLATVAASASSSSVAIAPSPKDLPLSARRELPESFILLCGQAADVVRRLDRVGVDPASWRTHIGNKQRIMPSVARALLRLWREHHDGRYSIVSRAVERHRSIVASLIELHAYGQSPWPWPAISITNAIAAISLDPWLPGLPDVVGQWMRAAIQLFADP